MKRLGLLTLAVLLFTLLGASPVRTVSALLPQTDAPDWDVRGGWQFSWGNGGATLNLSVTSEDFATGALGFSGTQTINGTTTAINSTGRSYMSTVMLAGITVDINSDGSLKGLASNILFPGLTSPAHSATAVHREFAFTVQPQAVVAGAVMAPVQVTVQLTTGEVLTHFEDKISMHLGAGVPGGISGHTLRKPINGVATFDDLTVSVPFAGARLMAEVAPDHFPLPTFDPVDNSLSAPFDIHGTTSRIIGLVTDPGGTPLANVLVGATSLGGSLPSVQAATDANGNYELDVLPGLFTVTAVGPAAGLRPDPPSAVADTTIGDAAVNFVITHGPVISSVDPSSGPVTNAPAITVGGSGFGSAGAATACSSALWAPAAVSRAPASASLRTHRWP